MMSRARAKMYWTARGQSPRWQLLGAYVLILLAFLHANHEAHESASQAKNAIIYYCLQTNMRHNRTVEAVRNAPPRANVDKVVVIQLIDALAPVTRDCSKAFEVKLPGR